MRFQNVAIESIASVRAPVRTSSAAIEERLNGAMARMKLPPRPIEGFTGIVERGLWAPRAAAVDAAAEAGRLALARAGVRPDQLGLLVNTSVYRELLEPSTASRIHGALGLPPTCRNFDVANACLGFLNGIELAGQLLDAGVVEYALIVDGEDSRPLLEATIRRLNAPDATAKDFWDNFASLTLGSTAVAMVVGRLDRSRTGHRVNGSVGLAATEHNQLCYGTNEGMTTDSTRLLRAGVELARQTWEVAAQQLDRWSDATIDHYVCHQVGKAHLASLCQTLGLTASRCVLSYPTFGNVGPAAVPLTLHLAEEAGRLHRGDHVALMGIGSGINVAMMSVTW